jgi:hypothetical protein
MKSENQEICQELVISYVKVVVANEETGTSHEKFLRI